MATANDAPGKLIATWWRRLSPLPGGRALFSMMIGRMAPYTGSIGARCLELESGHSRWQMKDRRGLRNHLRSLHALAIANLAEVASGTAMLMTLPAGTRGIVTGLAVTYAKKARGTVVAECRCTLPDIHGELPFEVHADVTDASGDIVARATVTWLLRRES